MLSPSDSDDLPDVAELIASQKRPSQSPAKRKRGPASPRHSSGRQPAPRDDPSTSRPRKKRKIRGTQVNGKAKASTPIELTSDEEPQRRNPKPKSKPANTKKRPQTKPTEVIDLCSEPEDKPPSPRRPKATQARAPPRDEDVINLLSSDNEDKPGPSTRAKVPNGVHRPPQSTNTPPAKRLRRQDEDEDEQPTVPRKRPRRPSDSLSPVPIIDSQKTQTPRISPHHHRAPLRSSHSSVLTEEPRRRSSSEASNREQTSPVIEPQHVASPFRELDQLPETKESPQHHQFPLPRQVPREVEEYPSPEADEPTEPLQTIYNNLFQPLPDPEPASTPCRAFSFKARFPPHPATALNPFEPFDSDASPPPLLTTSFFNRAIRALSQSVKPSSSTQDPPDRQDATVEAEVTENPNVESPKASSLPAKATAGNALPSDESNLQRSTPPEQSKRDATLATIVTEVAMAPERVEESKLELTPSQEAQPSYRSSSPEKPTFPTLEVQGLAEEASTAPETTMFIDEIISQATPTKTQGGNQTRTFEVPPVVEDQPVKETVEVTPSEDPSPENTSTTDETSQQVDIRLSMDGQPEMLAATELEVASPDLEDAPLSATLLPAASLPTPSSPARPETPVAMKTPPKPQPHGGETAPNTPTITFTVPHPPPIQLDTSPMKVGDQDTTTVSPLDSSGRSESTNDNDIQEIADMLLPTSDLSEFTDEELLAIGLCYPDFDEED